MKCQSIGTNFQTRTVLPSVVEVSGQTSSPSLSLSFSLPLPLSLSRHQSAHSLCLTRWWWSRRTWCVFDSCACPTYRTHFTWSTTPCLSAVTWSATSKWRAPRQQPRQSWPMRSQVRRSSRDARWWCQTLATFARSNTWYTLDFPGMINVTEYCSLMLLQY